MKKLLCIASMFTLGGCFNLDSALTPIGSVVGEASMGACTWDPMGNTYEIDTQYNPTLATSMRLVVQLQNNLEANAIQFAEDPAEVFVPPNNITPLRFDMRWECDTDALSAGLGAMILPQFSFDRPFCLDNRGDTTGNFVGFDVIPASGAAITPGGGIGVAEINPVTSQMGEAVRDMFEISRLADACCSEDTDCATSVQRDPNNFGAACSALNTLFTQLGDANRIKNAEFVSRMQRFSSFDATSPGAFIAQGGVAQYNMRLRGVFEGVTSDGDLVSSTEFAQLIGFCRGNMAECPMNECSRD